MKIQQIPSLKQKDYPGETESFYKLLAFLTNILGEFVDGFRKRITFDENIDSDRLEAVFQHAVPVKFINPSGKKRTEIISANCRDRIIIGHKIEYNQNGETVITILFDVPSVSGNCIVRVI